MSKFDITMLQNHFGCKESYHNCMLAELIFLVLSESSNNTGYTLDKEDELRKTLYGEDFGTAVEKVLHISGYWSNDLAIIFSDTVGYDGNIFQELFKMLKGKEVIEGVSTLK